jgi:hypothetical protein
MCAILGFILIHMACSNSAAYLMFHCASPLSQDTERIKPAIECFGNILYGRIWNALLISEQMEHEINTYSELFINKLTGFFSILIDFANTLSYQLTVYLHLP